MRRWFGPGLLLAFVIGVLGIGIAVGAHAGWDGPGRNVSSVVVPQGSSVVVVDRGGRGFFPFGFFLFPLFFFGFIVLLRGAFFCGGHWRGGPGPWMSPSERFDEWHRRAYSRDAVPAGPPSEQTTPAGDQL